MINRFELLISFSKKFTIHQRMWEAEWNRNNTSDLSYPQFLILSILSREGPLQSKDLVNSLSITSGGITTIANKLISQGLLYRRKEEQQDRRAIYLEISEEGRIILATLEKVRDRTFDVLFSCLTDAEIAYLEQIYGKMNNEGKANKKD